MPWQEQSIMDQRLEFVTLATAAGANVSVLCERFAVSRDVGYKWIRRYREGGVGALTDRSRRPRTSPRQSPAAAEQLVVDMRRQHPAWGSRKIRARLQELGEKGVPAKSTISDILRRHGLLSVDSPSHPGAFVRFERGRSNELWQMDFKGHVPFLRGGRCHPFTMLDDHSRYCLSLQACADEQEGTAKECLTAAFRCYGLPEQMLCDNGSPWGAAGEEDCYTTLEVWLLRLGVRMTHGRVRHPQTQGKEERFHRTLKAELLSRQDLRDGPHAQSLFDPWRQMYNTERPHEALNLATPSTRYRVSDRAFPETLPDLGYQHGEELRKVHQHGRICYRGALWRIGKAFVGQQVALRPTSRDGVVEVCYGPHRLAELDGRAPGVVLHVRRPLAALAADAHAPVLDV